MNFFGQQVTKLYQSISFNSLISVKALVIIYTVAYLALSLFPFDFITSFAEFDEKMANGNDHLIMSLAACSEGVFRCLLKLVTEVAVLIPLGFFCCLLPYVTHKRALVLILGFLLGLFCESIQLFLYSGVFQGISILTRMLGMGLGATFYFWISKQHSRVMLGMIRPLLLVSILPYVISVMLINGWLNAPWLSADEALIKLANTNFLPLYYYYFTSETVALISLMSI